MRAGGCRVGTVEYDICSTDSTLQYILLVKVRCGCISNKLLILTNRSSLIYVLRVKLVKMGLESTIVWYFK